MLYYNGTNNGKGGYCLPVQPEHLGKFFSIWGAFIAFGRN